MQLLLPGCRTQVVKSTPEESTYGVCCHSQYELTELHLCMCCGLTPAGKKDRAVTCGTFE